MAEITLRFSHNADGTDLQAYHVTVEALSATDMPTKIFVFQAGVIPARPGGSETRVDRFVAVAEPVDLEDFPEDAPDLGGDMPYYRLDSMTVRLRCRSDLEEFVNAVKDDVAKLKYALEAGGALDTVEEVTI